LFIFTNIICEELFYVLDLALNLMMKKVDGKNYGTKYSLDYGNKE